MMVYTTVRVALCCRNGGSQTPDRWLNGSRNTQTYYGSQLTEEDLRKICDNFPQAVITGTGVGDLSIVRAYEKYKDETPGVEEIRIWSYDRHLEHYHEIMDMPPRRRR